MEVVRFFTPFVLAGLLVFSVLFTVTSLLKAKGMMWLGVIFSALSFVAWNMTIGHRYQFPELQNESLFVGFLVSLLLLMFNLISIDLRFQSTRPK